MGNIDQFNWLAGHYDTPERTEIATVIAGTIRSTVRNGAEKSAIDYGCGTGLVGLQLLDVFRRLLLVDASHPMIEQVKRKLGQLPDHNATTLCCDFVTEYPAELRADYILMVQTLLHVKEVELLLSHLYTAVHPGGHLLIVDFNRNSAIVSEEVHPGFDTNELTYTLRQAGFVRCKAQTFYKGERLFMNQAASLFIIDAEK